MIVAAAGSRKYMKGRTLFKTMDRMRAELNFDGVIHGACSGVDSLVDQWCEQNGVQPIACRALWNYWRAAGRVRIAGPRRNLIIARLKPRYLFAFPGGAGTWDCVKQCHLAFVQILDCDGAEWNERLRAEDMK